MANETMLNENEPMDVVEQLYPTLPNPTPTPPPPQQQQPQSLALTPASSSSSLLIPSQNVETLSTINVTAEDIRIGADNKSVIFDVLAHIKRPSGLLIVSSPHCPMCQIVMPKYIKKASEDATAVYAIAALNDNLIEKLLSVNIEIPHIPYFFALDSYGAIMEPVLVDDLKIDEDEIYNAAHHYLNHKQSTITSDRENQVCTDEKNVIGFSNGLKWSRKRLRVDGRGSDDDDDSDKNNKTKPSGSPQYIVNNTNYTESQSHLRMFGNFNHGYMII